MSSLNYNRAILNVPTGSFLGPNPQIIRLDTGEFNTLEAQDITVTGGINGINISGDQIITSGAIPQTVGGDFTVAGNRIARSSIVVGAVNPITITHANPAAPRTYNIPDMGADATFVLVAGGGGGGGGGSSLFATAVVVTTVTNQLVLGVANTATINANMAASRIYSITDSGTNAAFVVDDGTAPLSIQRGGNGIGIASTDVTISAPIVQVISDVITRSTSAGVLVETTYAGSTTTTNTTPQPVITWTPVLDHVYMMHIRVVACNQIGDTGMLDKYITVKNIGGVLSTSTYNYGTDIVEAAMVGVSITVTAGAADVDINVVSPLATPVEWTCTARVSVVALA